MRLIDENEAINALRNEFKRSPTIAIRAMEVIRSLTPVTPQPEIIRCKECKFYTSIQKHSMNLKIGICSLSSRYIGDDGFCSEAERQEK